jgi:hypothetical protein
MDATNAFAHSKNLERFQKLIDETKDEPLRKRLFELLAELLPNLGDARDQAAAA